MSNTNNPEVNTDATEQAIAVKEQAELAATPEVPMGFEEDDAGDMIIPRIKVIQTLSPERKDKIANEGDIINSLTKEKLNGKKFIPVFKFTNIILWRDRAEGGGMIAISRDGRMMVPLDGSDPYPVGTLADFDNTKKGRDALPKATRYLNFLGFFEGERLPMILSFAKTNYNEGKKLYSLAKVTMQNMWNYGYALTEKLMAKNGNEWYIMVATPAGPTSAEDREFGLNLYKTFRNTIQNVNYDLDDNSAEASPSAPADLDKTEF